MVRTMVEAAAVAAVNMGHVFHSCAAMGEKKNMAAY